MARIAIISVGKLKTKYYKDACDDYIKRIKRYAAYDNIEISEHTLTKNPSDKEIDIGKEIEAKKILEKAKAFDVFYCMDIQGKKNTSVSFSKIIQSDFNKGKNSIAFVVGGSHGLCEAVKKQSNGLLSFSDMTFAHHLFKVMLLEQIYRAFTIMGNEKYHK